MFSAGLERRPALKNSHEVRETAQFAGKGIPGKWQIISEANWHASCNLEVIAKSLLISRL
jgi:hypothetical protein